MGGHWLKFELLPTVVDELSDRQGIWDYWQHALSPCFVICC